MQDKSDPMYREFADTDLRNWPYVDSLSARQEMKRIAERYLLSFALNPGGGEFKGMLGRCQITTYDDVADLATLRQFVAEKILT